MVQRNNLIILSIAVLDLNTYHVMVQLVVLYIYSKNLTYLNTYHVMVQPAANISKNGWDSSFKYISCYGSTKRKRGFKGKKE